MVGMLDLGKRIALIILYGMFASYSRKYSLSKDAILHKKLSSFPLCKVAGNKVGDKTVDCCKDVLVVFKQWHTVITQKGYCEQPRQFTDPRNSQDSSPTQ